MSENHKHEHAEHDKTVHWPTILLGLAVALVFLTAIFSYQVQSNELAVVTTLGKITSVEKPGLHFRWPYPIQNITKYDIRQRCFDGNIGKNEETITKDSKNVIIGIYVIYKISDPAKFYKTAVDVLSAEEKLGNLMRTAKDGVIGRYAFDQILNTDKSKMVLPEIEKEIRNEIAKTAMDQFGIEVNNVGIKTLIVPEKITKEISARMVSERNVLASVYRAEGKQIAEKIKIEADRQKRAILTDAEAKAKSVRAEGDAEAASYYAVFKENPELAAFLKKLDSLKKIMETKTTLVLDTDSAPFDLLKTNAEKLTNPELKQEKK